MFCWKIKDQHCAETFRRLFPYILLGISSSPEGRTKFFENHNEYRILLYESGAYLFQYARTNLLYVAYEVEFLETADLSFKLRRVDDPQVRTDLLRNMTRVKFAATEETGA